MQGLLTAFENRGLPVAATTEGVRVSILDENLAFGIEESLKKIKHAVTAETYRVAWAGRCRSSTMCSRVT